MATDKGWSNGYLEQARVDLVAMRILQGQVPSVSAMLAQMVMEKLSKAALLRSGQLTVQSAQASHTAAVTMMRALASNYRACKRLGYRATTVRDLVWLVDELERSHPSIARTGPHLEYPWLSDRGDVCWPAKHLGVVKNFQVESSYGTKLLLFAKQLAERFDQVFPADRL